MTGWADKQGFYVERDLITNPLRATIVWKFKGREAWNLLTFRGLGCVERANSVCMALNACSVSFEERDRPDRWHDPEGKS